MKMFTHSLLTRSLLTRSLSSALFAAALTLSLAGVSRAEPETITFLHVNDVYEISPKGGAGGLGQLGALLKAERASAKYTITTLGGDLLSPSILSGMTQGSQMIELMNALKLDVAVPGNHEFDFGEALLATRVGESNFPWLGTNVLDASGKPAAGMVATHLIKTGAYTIGFFGLLTPQTDVLSSPGENITFASVIEAAKTAVAALKEAGADVIVALTHLDIASDRELVRSVKGINLVLGGHDHDPMTVFEGNVLIHKSGYDARHLGAVDMTVDIVEKRGKMKLVVSYAWRMTSTVGVTPDQAIQTIVDKYQSKLDRELDVVIGETSVMLDSQRSSLRTGETNFGNLIAQAMMESVGADIGLTNGGGIRGDRTYDPGTKLTRKDILGELPFGNVTLLIELSGADLLEALENGVSEVENKAGRFPQIAGMTMVYDPSAPAGSRVTEVKVGGAALDKNKAYRIATNDYMAAGGDGYASLKRAKIIIDAAGATLMATTVINYVEAAKTISPKTDGRISTK